MFKIKFLYLILFTNLIVPQVESIVGCMVGGCIRSADMSLNAMGQY